MKKIVLLCAAGMSTSILVRKMKEAAEVMEFACTIDAFAVSSAKEHQDADVILLGPQVRFNVDKVKKDVPGVPVEAIDMTAYGMMDGAKVMNRVKEILA